MDREDDEVGYCKPPKHTQFQKGRSGNPKGRPKGSSSFKAAIGRATKRQVSVKIGNRTVKMTPIDAMAHRLVQKALDGDLKALRELVTLGGLEDEFAASAHRADGLTGDDFAILRRAMARVDDEAASQVSSEVEALEGAGPSRTE